MIGSDVKGKPNDLKHVSKKTSTKRAKLEIIFFTLQSQWNKKMVIWYIYIIIFIWARRSSWRALNSMSVMASSKHKCLPWGKLKESRVLTNRCRKGRFAFLLQKNWCLSIPHTTELIHYQVYWINVFIRLKSAQSFITGSAVSWWHQISEPLKN